MKANHAVAALVFISISAPTSVVLADDDVNKASLRNTNPLTNIGANTATGFTGWNAALHLSAIALTPAIVQTGADTDAHNYFARHQSLETYTLPGVIAGYALPVVAGGSLLAYGLNQDSEREVAAASSVVQATAIALTYQSLLKAFTGRPAPAPEVYEDDSASQTFRFGFMRGGIHYGWPSGHMMTTTAIVGSLLPLYPDSWELRLGSVAFLTYMAGSVAIHESSSMHWISDMAAGTLMGFAIGNGVGEGFARHVGIGSESDGTVSVMPLICPEGGLGLSVSGTL